MKSLFATLALVVFSNANAADFLYYQFNAAVIIKIAKVPCPLKELAKDYPLGAVAERNDGQYMFGCYAPENENDLKFKWAQDKTGLPDSLPANAFLVHPELPNPRVPNVTPEIEPTL